MAGGLQTGMGQRWGEHLGKVAVTNEDEWGYFPWQVTKRRHKSCLQIFGELFSGRATGQTGLFASREE